MLIYDDVKMKGKEKINDKIGEKNVDGRKYLYTYLNSTIYCQLKYHLF